MRLLSWIAVVGLACGCSNDAFVGGDDVGSDGGIEAIARNDASIDEASEAATEDVACDAPVTYFLDGDHDGYGGTSTTIACAPPSSDWITRGGDCDDGNADVNPGQNDFFATGYVPTGKTQISFDYDCSGVEEESGSPVHAYCHASGLNLCTGDGYVPATPTRTGAGVDAYCGSTETTTCAIQSNLACGENAPTATQPIACH
jgi:hypothetical protein